jgi:hypothetical protein
VKATFVKRYRASTTPTKPQAGAQSEAAAAMIAEATTELV